MRFTARGRPGRSIRRARSPETRERAGRGVRTREDTLEGAFEGRARGGETRGEDARAKRGNFSPENHGSLTRGEGLGGES